MKMTFEEFYLTEERVTIDIMPDFIVLADDDAEVEVTFQTTNLTRRYHQYDILMHAASGEHKLGEAKIMHRGGIVKYKTMDKGGKEHSINCDIKECAKIIADDLTDNQYKFLRMR